MRGDAKALLDEMSERDDRGGTRPRTRGRSQTRCHTTSSKDTPEYSLVKGYSTLTQCPDSLKREQAQLLAIAAGMPTQSLTQKTSKLKSIVTLPPKTKFQVDWLTDRWQPKRCGPYHLLTTQPEEFLMYIMGFMSLCRDYYEAKFNNLMVFSRECTSMSRQIMASILYAEVTWFQGHSFVLPIIPCQFEETAPKPHDVPLPLQPKETRRQQNPGVREQCQVWWHYYLGLI